MDVIDLTENRYEFTKDTPCLHDV